MATVRRKESTDESVVVIDGTRLCIRSSPASRRILVIFLAFVIGLSGLALGVGGVVLGTAAGITIGLLVTRKPIWVLDRASDAVLDFRNQRVGQVTWVQQIKVKGEMRAKESRLVHYVALVGPGSQIKIGRWTPKKVGPIVAALAAYLNVPVVQKGEPMPGTVAEAVAKAAR